MLLTLAYVVCCDETPIRVGPRKAKKYLLVACNQMLTWYMLGGRDLATFKRFVLADLTGVVVHDRYQNYDRRRPRERDHQLCARTCSATLKTVPRPTPARAGRPDPDGAARADPRRQPRPRAGQGRHRRRAPWRCSRMFRGGVPSACRRSSACPARPRPSRSRSAVLLLEVLRDREADVLRFAPTCGSHPPTTRPNATCAPPRPSRRSPDDSAPSSTPGTGTPSAATYPPRSNTASTS